MLLTQENSLLAVIDIQEKLLPGVHNNEALVANTKWLVDLANLLEVPVVGTEQYPQGVGHTVDVLRNEIDAEKFAGKTIFSCVDAPECQSLIIDHPAQNVILCGMETHVCILQTALQLASSNRNIFVVADAVSSRNPNDSDLAIERMRQNGIHIVSKEMVGFEWIRDSAHPHFKTFSRDFLR